MARQSFDRNKRHYVDPVIVEKYEKQKERALEAASKPLRVASDGQFDRYVLFLDAASLFIVF
jgi:hypothetical protein